MCIGVFLLVSVKKEKFVTAMLIYAADASLMLLSR